MSSDRDEKDLKLVLKAIMTFSVIFALARICSFLAAGPIFLNEFGA